MEDDLANLHLTNAKDEAFQEDAKVVERELDLSLVDTCLTESLVHFPSLWNTMVDL